jgi:hypothetical protein
LDPVRRRRRRVFDAGDALGGSRRSRVLRSVLFLDVGSVGIWTALTTMNVARIAALSLGFRRGRWGLVAADGVLA